MKQTRRSAACDRLLDALTEELLLADIDDIDPRHTGRTLAFAADEVRRRVAEVLRLDVGSSAPVPIPFSDNAWPGADGHNRHVRNEPR